MKWLLILLTCSMFAQVDSVYIFHPDGRFLIKNYKGNVTQRLDSLNEIYQTDRFVFYWFYNDGKTLVSDVRKRTAPKQEII